MLKESLKQLPFFSIFHSYPNIIHPFTPVWLQVIQQSCSLKLSRLKAVRQKH